MKKSIKKLMATFLTLSLVATLVFGTYCFEETRADDKVATEIYLENDGEYYTGEEFEYCAYLYDANTTDGIQGETLTLQVDEQTYTAITDQEGMASFYVGFDFDGDYEFVVSYAGNDYYQGSTNTEWIYVEEEEGGGGNLAGAELDSYYPDTVYVGEEFEYRVNLHDFNTLEGIGGAEVELEVYDENGDGDDDATYSGTTDSEGNATFKITLNEAKEYAFDVIFEGDEVYDWCELEEYITPEVRGEGESTEPQEVTSPSPTTTTEPTTEVTTPEVTTNPEETTPEIPTNPETLRNFLQLISYKQQTEDLNPELINLNLEFTSQ